jgi:hypothetical protein
MEDAVTSNPGTILIILSLFTRSSCWSIEFLAIDSFAAPPHVIDLPDDDEDVSLRSQGGRNRKVSAGKTPQSASATETAIQEGGNANRTSVTFAIPLTSAQPSASTAQTPADPSSLFAAHHVPEDQVGAAKEAIRQAGIMMEQMKMVREASQAAYDASSALQSNVQVG